MTAMKTDAAVKGKPEDSLNPHHSSLGPRRTTNAAVDSGDESSSSERISISPGVKTRRAGRRHVNPAADDRPTTDELRRTLYSRLVQDPQSNRNIDDLKKTYKASAQECLRDEFGPCPTMLHWTVRRAEIFFDELSDKEFNALLELLQITLALNEDLLVERDKRDDTALHMALASEELSPLVVCMCDNASKETMKKALAVINSKGETCVHLAVAGGLDIASRLVKLADPKSLLKQRRIESSGKDLPGGGNTPLHDVVAYERCITKELKCRKKDGCIDCPYIEDQAWKRREYVLEMVELLVSKNSKALTIKNATDQSPYLHHLSTRAGSYKEGAVDEVKKQTQGRALEIDGVPTPPKAETPVVLNDALPASLKPNSSKVVGSAHSGEKSKADQTVAGGSRATVNATRQKPKDRSMPPPDLNKCEIVKSDCLADEVKEYLLECSFLLGSFESACKCLFGDRRDKDYKDPNFRPGHALGSIEDSCYEDLLDPPSLMSQVNLIVPVTDPDSTGWNTLPTEDQQLKRQSLWKDDMDSLQSVFDLIRQKNVKRILKLTVIDNSQRPCSDEVISNCLRGFDVRYLDWRKDDLCINVLLKAAPRVVELWLYTSSNSAVLRGWAASNGICSLKRTSTLHLDDRKGLVTDIISKTLESYECYISKIRMFKNELRRNVAAVRVKLFLRSKREALQDQLKYERNRREQTEQRLALLYKGIESRKSKRAELIERNNNSEGPKPKLESRIGKYDHEIEDAELMREELQNGERDSKRKSEILVKDAKTLAGRIKQLDEDTEEAQIQTLLIGSTEWPSEATDDASKAGQERADVGSIPGFSSLPQTLIENIPKLFGTRSGHIGWNFSIDAKIEDEPKEGDEDDIDIKLEESEEIEAPFQQQRWLKNMADFLDKNVRGSSDSSTSAFKVKVALIDDGVDANLDLFKGFIHPKGWPQGEPTSNEYPFYHSAAGHGTAMARLMHTMCPNIQLYVAKLGAWAEKERVGRLGEASTADNARKAVEWAIKQKVHIISMSWSLVHKDGSDKLPSNSEQIRLLDDQIKEAARQGIIMYCAAADEGLYGSSKELYPKQSDTEHIKAVGSAQEFGQQSQFVDASQVDYLFPGEKIEGLRGKKGSSAATAIAAGLAALILWCFEKHLGSVGLKKIAHPKQMHHLFTKLKARESKWVDATKVFKEGASIATAVNYCSKVVDTMD